MNTAITILATATTLSLCIAGDAQNTPATQEIDPFIEAVEAMKHSVAPLVCVAVNSAESKILDRRGTAFFLSTSGEFMTAAHVVLDMEKNDPPCSMTAVILPHNKIWDPSALNEPSEWFAFNIRNCVIERDLDLAKCPLSADPFNQKVVRDFEIVPVKFDWSIPPDATQVAFTGFPMKVRDPMTFRANLAAYRPVWRREKVVPELVLDRSAWPGSSGSPVFLSDGKVVGIVIASRTEEGTAMTAVRPASVVRALLAGREKK
jgi:hypothetical protein